MAIRCVILILSFVFFPAFGKVPKPINVTVESLNFKNILRWSMPDTGENVKYTYTMEYSLYFLEPEDFRTVCITNTPECDFSLVTYESKLRVRAALYANVSDWANITFDPYKQTILGPPAVKVTPRAGTLDVSFWGPNEESDGSSVKDKYGYLLYRLVYWKENTNSDGKIIETSQNYETLPGLETWTTYCVKVQVYAKEFDNLGQFSPVICQETTDDGKIPVWMLVLAFLLPMFLVIAVVSSLFYLGHYVYQQARFVYFPSYSFPQHLKEFLNKPFHSTLHLPQQPTEEGGESCEALMFVSEETEYQTDKVKEKQPQTSNGLKTSSGLETSNGSICTPSYVTVRTSVSL
ncbi:interleukin-10 receptor subunit beta [Pelobates cultripes]|uniref:Interleukin-10 receptor subunit beta n=1 Tax=Pelobates cultripes TaxID=61616 RepID=A0AAD1QZ49_PELCU|nr:interleukin-10 receptor subunit beta [Pelobates cultripes]